jgi:hypothetical protein
MRAGPTIMYEMYDSAIMSDMYWRRIYALHFSDGC